MTHDIAPALVIGGGSANGLGIARNLSSRGIPVYSVTSDPKELTLVSRYCRGSMILPRVESDPAVLAALLHRFQRRIPGPGVLFPTTDTALLTVTALGERIQPYVTPIPDRQVVETMVLKDRFYRSLQAHNIPHPLTQSAEALVAGPRASEIAFPVFVRPAQSLLFHTRIGGKGFVAHNLQELQRYLQVADRADLRVMVQEIIPGPPRAEYTIWGYIDRQGKTNVVLVTQTVRKPRMFANACVIVSVPRALVRTFERGLFTYFHRIQYRGLFGAECKWDARDQQFKLLEVNARSMSGNEMALACGVNHILAAYWDVLEDPQPPQFQYRTGVHLIHALNDLSTLVQRGLDGRLSLQELHPYGGRKHWFAWSLRDPRPWLRAVWRAIPKLRHVLVR